MRITGKEWVVNFERLSRVGLVNKVTCEQRFSNVRGDECSGGAISIMAPEEETAPACRVARNPVTLGWEEPGNTNRR